MDEPEAMLDPFPRPNWLSPDAPGSGGELAVFDFADIFPVIFAVVFFIWLAYSLVVAYHWFRYGHRSFLVVPMLALHIIVSGTLMILATAGLR